MRLGKKLFYLFFPLILGSLVGVIISGSIDYKDLIQPYGAPPSWLFPVMWSIIYLLMGISYYLLKQDNDNEVLSKIYYIQLGVNLLWSIIFFVFKLRLVACLWIILLDILVGLMIYWFYNTKRVSGYLNFLYMGWILFATYLTIGIYILN
jgi:tryptophan-rich sensory protein